MAWVKRHSIAILLLCILVFHGAGNFFWLREDYAPDGTAVNLHVIESIRFHVIYNKIMHAELPLYDKLAFLGYALRYWKTQNWPPLIYLLAAVVNPHHFDIFRTRLLINLLFFIILIVSTYFIGKKCFGKKVGLLAAFLVSMYPSLYVLSRQFDLDFPLSGMVALSVCLLIHSEQFSRSAYSLLFGLILGLGTLVKLQILFFVGPLLLYTLFRILRNKGPEQTKQTTLFLLAIGMVLLLASVYWGSRLERAYGNIYRHAFSLYPHFTGNRVLVLGWEDIPVFSFRSLAFYPASLIYHMTAPLVALFIFGGIKFLSNERKWRFFFLAGLLSAYAILTLVSVKWGRYSVPLLYMGSIISARYVYSITHVTLRKLMLCCIILYCLSVYAAGSWFRGSTRLVRPLQCFIVPEIAYPWRPQPDGYLKAFEESGIIERLSRSLDDGRLLSINCIRYTSRIQLCLYLYFSEYIDDQRIMVRISDTIPLRMEDDYMVVTEPEITKEITDQYRVLAVFSPGDFFLEKK